MIRGKKIRGLIILNKKITTILLCICLLFCLVAPAVATPKVNINGNQLIFEVDPIVENGRTLVPLRAIFEALGANVSWDGTTQLITATKDETIIKLQIGSQTAYKNNQPVPLDVPPKIVEDRTLVPLRFVSESLGANVKWYGDTQTITITKFEVPKTLPPVFKGFFKNTDYSNPNNFLYCGDQTKVVDSSIKEIAKSFNDNRDITTIEEIFRWINQNLQYGNGEKFGRTASDIIKTRMFTGCTDMGLAFAALSREKGIPIVFVQTAKIDWIKDYITNNPDKNHLRGHILVEVYLSDNKWYLVDSTAGKLFLNYNKDNMSLNDGYYVFSKSIEVWDTGIKNEKENYVNVFNIFKGFDVNKYVVPLYEVKYL
jgi:hypothetical protein